MASITLKDIPADLHARLKAEAAASGRSLNREVLVLLRAAMEWKGRTDPGERLRTARALRARMRGVAIDDAFLRRARSEGRP